MSQNAPFPIDVERTAISVAYRNRRMVADEVLRRVPVGKQEFTYVEQEKSERFTVPETQVGRKGTPNMVEFSGTEKTSQTYDYALDDGVPQNDIDNADARRDPVDVAVEGVSDLLALSREVRVANLVFNAANYGADNKVQLAGNDQWSDFANSDPLKDILGAMDGMLVRPNRAVMGSAVWLKLRQHPKVAKATHGNSGDVTVAAKQAVAELLELEELIIGEAFVNTAKKGQNAVYSRTWGKHFLLFAQDQLAGPDMPNRITFGYTAEWRPRSVRTGYDKNIGANGGTHVRVVESLRELIVAPDAAYFIEDAVA